MVVNKLDIIESSVCDSWVECIGLRNMFVIFLYFLLFHNDFLLLGKMYSFDRAFDRALPTVKNCADRLFEYFEILLFVRLTYGISMG